MGKKLEAKYTPATKQDEVTNLKLTPKQMLAYSYLTDMDNGVTEVLYGGGAII